MLPYLEKLQPKKPKGIFSQKKILCIVEGDLELRYIVKIFKLFGYKDGCYPLTNELIKVAWGKNLPSINIVKPNCSFQGGSLKGSTVPLPAIEAYELYRDDLSIFEAIIIFFDGDKDSDNSVEEYFKEVINKDRDSLVVSIPCFESTLIDFCSCGSCRIDIEAKDESKYPCDRYKEYFSKLNCFEGTKNLIGKLDIDNIRFISKKESKLNITNRVIQDFMKNRKIINWLTTTSIDFINIKVASSDASFRSYYRLYQTNSTKIIMDSSLQKETLIPFLDVTNRLSSVGVNTPTIYNQDLDSGFLLLEDFGDINLLDILDKDNFKLYYKMAIDEIIKIQEACVDNIPIYDREFLRSEMELMEKWYLKRYLGVKIDRDIISSTIESILDIVLSQPQGVFVHRDFHSRNIMVRANDTLGVIDYQDARVGAVTYDLVSLLRDVYIEFGREDIEELVLYFRDKKALNISNREFIKYFDFMGLQRHIKILGIFARLSLRDGKDNYLDDIPQTLKYIVDIGMRYEESREVATILNSSYNQ